MTLRQLHALKTWHVGHARHPVEKNAWDAVLVVWLIGWVGAPAAFLLHVGWAEAACLSVLYLPGLYVAVRRRLHRSRRLRCDWIGAVD